MPDLLYIIFASNLKKVTELKKCKLRKSLWIIYFLRTFKKKMSKLFLQSCTVLCRNQRKQVENGHQSLKLRSCHLKKQQKNAATLYQCSNEHCIITNYTLLRLICNFSNRKQSVSIILRRNFINITIILKFWLMIVKFFKVTNRCKQYSRAPSKR